MSQHLKWIMCEKMQRGQYCGRNCTFVHNPFELPYIPVDMRWKTEPCKHGDKKCRFGIKCAFLHDDEWFVRSPDGMFGFLINEVGILLKFQLRREVKREMTRNKKVNREMKRDKEVKTDRKKVLTMDIQKIQRDIQRDMMSVSIDKKRKIQTDQGECVSRPIYQSNFKPNPLTIATAARDEMRKRWFSAR